MPMASASDACESRIRDTPTPLSIVSGPSALDQPQGRERKTGIVIRATVHQRAPNTY
jgi:hypothetical protein